MTDVILDVSHIAKTFGHVQALKDITLSLRKGRVHTLLGENGAGKSTLMKILAGVYPPTQGTITLRGETITINNQLMGEAPTFKGIFNGRFSGKQMTLILNNCVSSKLSLIGTKLEDFSIPEFDFSASANDAGRVGTLSSAE